MLSRIAESLYWLGRHVERADCTARILDTYLHLLPAGSWQSDHQVIRSLLAPVISVGGRSPAPLLPVGWLSGAATTGRAA